VDGAVLTVGAAAVLAAIGTFEFLFALTAFLGVALDTCD